MIAALSFFLISVMIALNLSGRFSLPVRSTTKQTTTAFFVLESKTQAAQQEPGQTTERPEANEEKTDESGTELKTEATKKTDQAEQKPYDIKTYGVTDKSGKTIAERAVIKAEKKDFTEDGKENLNRIRKECLDGNDFSWFTVDFGDSTGIVFLSGSKDAACYGLLDGDGMIKELFGCLVISRVSDYSYFPVSKDETTEESQTETKKETETKESEKSDKDKKTTTETEKSTEPEETAQDKETTKKVTETKSEKNASSAENGEKSNSDSVVYITATGKKFHRAGCSSLSKSKIEIDRKDAVNDGYEPCKKCNP